MPETHSRQFERQLRSALASLYDPVSLRTHPFTQRLAAEQQLARANAGEALRQDLLTAIESLRPPGQAVTSAKPWRLYYLLQLRYVEARDPVDVQHQLAASKSQYYREHEAAVEALAELLQGRHSEQRRPGDEPKTPAPAGAGARSELPSDATSFIGREDDIQEIHALLATNRLVTLTGAGGSGKSRLALHIARQLSERGVVVLVELASLSESSLVTQTVAAAMGVGEVPGEPMLDTLIRGIQGRPLVLLLDNCEHLIHACAQLAHALLQACPVLSILATSREALRIGAEVVWSVPPLPTPDPAHLPLMDELARSEAIRLFVDRAAGLRPGFALNETNARGVAEICHRLDGMPLAVELAAARVPALSIEQIASRLNDRFRLLTVGSRVALPRQQTLEALVEWSYELLTEPEKRLFPRLAIFAGGWTLEAAEAVCAGDDIEVPEILDLTSSLVAKSLVIADVNAEGSVRYRMLETIREYANRRLVEGGAEHDLRLKHTAYYADFLRRTERLLYTGDQIESLTSFQTEHDNFRALLSAAHVPQTAPFASETAARSVLFWFLGNHYSEARHWLEWVLSADTHDGDPWRAACRCSDAFFLASVGDRDSATKLRDEGLRDARRSGFSITLAWALTICCSTSFIQGDAVATEETAKEAIPVCMSADWDWAAAMCEAWWGRALLMRGDIPAAVAKLQEALARSERVGDPFSHGLALSFLAAAEAAAGDYEQAFAHFAPAMETFRRLGSLAQQSRCLVDWAGALLDADRLDQAAVFLAEGLGLAEQLGNVPYRFAQLYLQVARLAAARGEAARAASLLAAARTLREHSGTGLSSEFQRPEQELVRELQSALGIEEFGRAWSAGLALTHERSLGVAYGITGAPRQAIP